MSIGGNPVPTSNTEEWTGPGVPIGAWSTNNSLNTGRRGVGLGTIGTQTAAIAISGQDAPNAVITNVEFYNGTNWTEGADVNTGFKYGAASGAPGSSIKYGGNAPPQTAAAETWNGSSWTEVGDLNSARSSVSGAGDSSTSAIAMAGYNIPPPLGLSVVETWNGTSWTETTDVNTARWGGGSIGVVPSAILVGGYNTASTGKTEEWNGSSWTEVNDLNTARYEGAGAGTTPDGMYFGGSAGSGATELWNGVSWTETSNMVAGIYGLGGGGDTTAGISYCGTPSTYYDSSYSWSSTSNATRTVSTD